MSCLGFYLLELRLTGENVDDAVVTFTKGLNVICGASDTGKTFILQCIDFIFGAKDRPKNILEANEYDCVALTVAQYEDNKCYTLKRKLDGKNIDIISDGENTKTVKLQHSKESKDTVSYFFLKLSGLEDKKIRTNADGKTQSLSFRNIVHLTCITEEQIIKEASPLLMGRNTSKTAELSIFKLLLSGVDDSLVEKIKTDKASKDRASLKNELLQDFIEKSKQEYSCLGIDGSYRELSEQLDKLENSYANTSIALSTAQESVNEQEKVKKEAWDELCSIESKNSVLNELRHRFSILEKQYQSDLARLDAIGEAGARLSEMPLERCIVCGSLLDSHQLECEESSTLVQRVSMSSVVEANKLRILLTDLQASQRDVVNEIRENRKNKKDLEDKLLAITKKIDNILKPQLKALIETYREGEQVKYTVKKALELKDRLSEYESLIVNTEPINKQDKNDTKDAFIAKDTLEAFALEIEKRLRAWNFPNVTPITFEEKNWDLVMDGLERASHGKGVRAVMHAAFSLGLLSYCKHKHLPHPRVLIIDSPLVVYREPEASHPDKVFDVKDSFYLDISKTFSDAQVIIVENEPPSRDIIESGKCNFISFTKSANGRYGFIPVPSK